MEAAIDSLYRLSYHLFYLCVIQRSPCTLTADLTLILKSYTGHFDSPPVSSLFKNAEVNSFNSSCNKNLYDQYMCLFHLYGIISVHLQYLFVCISSFQHGWVFNITIFPGGGGFGEGG